MKTVEEKILEYLEENEDEFISIIEELDNYNGYLGDDRYYDMESLDELFYGKPATELLNMAFFGYDSETWHTDSHGNKEYGAFNPNREYFTFNGYGNLVSADYKDYSAHLDHYLVQALAENRNEICGIICNDELSALFDQLEDEE